jgi:ABC-type phosphate transport system substrate-binding protein
LRIADSVGHAGDGKTGGGAHKTTVAHKSTEEVFVRSISKRVLGGAAAAAVVTAGLLAAAASPAAAEPTGTPAATDIVAVGSDTLQAVYNKFQADYSGLQSFNAVGSSPITPKAGCANIATRPNGSGAGIKELGKNLTTSDNAHYCVNVARSSRTPATGDPAGLSWVALGADAVSWSAVNGGNAPGTLTGDQLYHIFSCDTGFTHWNEVGGSNTAVIKPVLPQTSSGTRAFFLQALNLAHGLSGGSLTPGSCVDQTSQPEENQGANSLFNPASNPDAVNIVYPYSAAVYASQVYNHTTTDSGPGTLTIRQIGGVDAVDTTATPVTENAALDASFQRTVYTVVRSASRGNPTGKDGNIDALITFECGTTGQADLKSYGFGSIDPFCGNVDFTT